jgi:hypothetical protein
MAEHGPRRGKKVRTHYPEAGPARLQLRRVVDRADAIRQANKVSHQFYGSF